jgi:lipopolysaccharide/colanic/teichoic acid biosynthesis glycosyltransferase
MKSTHRNLLLLAGDLTVLYWSLFLALVVRGGGNFAIASWDGHFWPFSIINAFWLISLYIQDFYSTRRLKINGEFYAILLRAAAVNTALAVIFFYAWALAITPKTTLVLFAVFFVLLFTAWRSVAESIFGNKAVREPVYFIEPGAETQKLIQELKENPAAGWRVVDSLEEAQKIVVETKHLSERQASLYQHLLRGVEIVDSATFFERATGIVPFSLIDPHWLIRSGEIATRREFEAGKRLFDLAGAALAGAVFLPLVPFIITVVRLSGPILYRQKRTGRLGREFTLYKFRTMVPNAEGAGPQWTQKNDCRLTRVGRLLRHTHLDELPQLINVFKGEMSLVGPRPERPEFVSDLEKQIPFYPVRQLIKPGITGWAQINLGYGASVQDAEDKLTYDLFYVKHRSLLFDVKILVKTLAMFFRGEGR